MIESLAIVLLTVGVGIGGGFVSTLGHLDPESPQSYAYSVGFGNSQQSGNFSDECAVISGSPKFQFLPPPGAPIVPTKEFSSDIRTFALRETKVIFGPTKARNTFQHVLGHGPDCPACNEAKTRAMRVNLSPSMPFAMAAEQWRESRKDQLSAGSYENYRQYIKSLNTFFGQLTLEQIHIGHIEEYQESRKETAGPSRINHEISTLQQILKRAALWEEINRFYEPLPLPKVSPGIALEPEEEKHLFKIAAKKPKWKIAFCCALISDNTTMGPSEIRHLKLGDVDLPNRLVNIQEGVKNDFRIRTLPLNDDALWAMQQLVELSHDRGSYLPEHYILTHRPHVAGAKYDPLKPMGSWKTAWKSLRKEAGKKYPRLDTLRRYDLRHHAATKLLENPAISERTIEEMMGHKLNSRIKERYSHIRLQRKWEAVAALNNNHMHPEMAQKKRPEVVATSTTHFLFKTFL